MFRLRILALLGAVVFVAAACGDDSNSEDNGENGGSAGLSITAEDFQFSETELSADANSTVELTFTNDGDVAHTFTAEALGVDVVADPGATETVTFDVSGDASVAFMCRFHPQMAGTIAVGAGGSGTSDSGGGSNDDLDVDY